MKNTLIYIFLPAILIAIFISCYKSAGINHLYHLIYQPEDLYSPTVDVKYSVLKINKQIEFPFNPKYRDIYSITLNFPPDLISSGWNKNHPKYVFSGQLKFEVFKGTDKMLENTITNFKSAHFQKDMDFYNSISLQTFSLPFNASISGPLNIKITLIKADELLAKYKDDIVLQIGVSPIP